MSTQRRKEMYDPEEDERKKYARSNWNNLSTREVVSGLMEGKMPITRNKYDVNKGMSQTYYLDGKGNERDRPIWEQDGNLNNKNQNNLFGDNIFYKNGDKKIDISKDINAFSQKQNIDVNNQKKDVLYNDCRGDERYEEFLKRLKSPEFEGKGYEDNVRLVEQPTNTGISQKLLGDLFKKYPMMEKAYKPNENSTLNDTLKNLTQEQIDNIYCQEFYKPYRVKDIKDDRIAYSVFDMHVMTSPHNVARTFQKSLNEMGYPVKQDGVFGSETVNALNQVSQNNQTNTFMENHLKPNRINYLDRLKDKDDRPGWFYRTQRY